MNLLAWPSFLCGPVNAYRITGYMRAWFDLIISPGLVSSLFDGGWCLELPEWATKSMLLTALSFLLAQQPSKLLVGGFGNRDQTPSTFAE